MISADESACQDVPHATIVCAGWRAVFGGQIEAIEPRRPSFDQEATA